MIFDRKTFTLLHDGISHLKECSITELNFTSCDIEPEGYSGLLSLFKDKLLPNLERLVMPRSDVTVKFAIDLKDLLYKSPCPNLLQIVLTVEPEGIYELQKCVQCEACQSFKYLELVLPSSNISEILTNISNGKPLTCKTIENPCIILYIIIIIVDECKITEPHLTLCKMIKFFPEVANLHLHRIFIICLCILDMTAKELTELGKIFESKVLLKLESLSLIDCEWTFDSSNAINDGFFGKKRDKLLELNVNNITSQDCVTIFSNGFAKGNLTNLKKFIFNRINNILL